LSRIDMPRSVLETHCLSTSPKPGPALLVPAVGSSADIPEDIGTKSKRRIKRPREDPEILMMRKTPRQLIRARERSSYYHMRQSTKFPSIIDLATTIPIPTPTPALHAAHLRDIFLIFWQDLLYPVLFALNSEVVRMDRAGNVAVVKTKPYSDQNPGTSGLRKKTRIFMQPNYFENYVQSVLNVLRESAKGDFSNQTLVVGGDGRYYNRTAIQIILRIAAANGFGRILVGRDGYMSTPALSAVIRKRTAFGGFLLTASHNPGGIDADFGIKYNIENGGPAPERLTGRFHTETTKIAEYRTLETPDVDIGREGSAALAKSEIEVIDPFSDYIELLRELFDFEALRRLFEGGFRLLFDGMHGIAGPYAQRIFEGLLGAPQGTVLRGDPLEDFGGHHPDPNQVQAAELIRRMTASDAPDLGAACDGDADRNMIVGRGFFVSPGDSLAVIAEHAATCIPGYRKGLAGVARSMPTSTALDRVARRLGITCHETPTGWKFFGNLMDAGLCTICGEESFGTGSNHIREKDGLWAVLCWLSIIAGTRKSVVQLAEDHWSRFGRSYYQRRDFESLDSAGAARMIDALRAKVSGLQGKDFAGARIQRADEFSYKDPVDGGVSRRQGIRLFLDDGSRVICRFSGTGTAGATLRLYLERYRAEGNLLFESVIEPLARDAIEILQMRDFCGRDNADVIT
jgi:phosphoglucomutase